MSVSICESPWSRVWYSFVRSGLPPPSKFSCFSKLNLSKSTKYFRNTQLWFFIEQNYSENWNILLYLSLVGFGLYWVFCDSYSVSCKSLLSAKSRVSFSASMLDFCWDWLIWSKMASRPLVKLSARCFFSCDSLLQDYQTKDLPQAKQCIFVSLQKNPTFYYRFFAEWHFFWTTQILKTNFQSFFCNFQITANKKMQKIKHGEITN